MLHRKRVSSHTLFLIIIKKGLDISRGGYLKNVKLYERKRSAEDTIKVLMMNRYNYKTDTNEKISKKKKKC